AKRVAEEQDVAGSPGVGSLPPPSLLPEGPPSLLPEGPPSLLPPSTALFVLLHPHAAKISAAPTIESFFIQLSPYVVSNALRFLRPRRRPSKQRRRHREFSPEARFHQQIALNRNTSRVARNAGGVAGADSPVGSSPERTTGRTR